MNDIARIGSNNPPDQIDLTAYVLQELSAFLENKPVIQDHGDAKKAAELIKRGTIALRELNDSRDAQVRPLNTKVKEINTLFKAASDPLDKIIAQIKSRLTAHARAEEARRMAEAGAARQVALAAEKAAQEAAEREREAIENASMGEVGTGIGTAIQDTAAAEAEAAKAARAAVIAEKDSAVRIATDFGKAVAMRNVETLVVDNATSAVLALWPNEKIRDAILSAARDFRRDHAKLPKGISARIDRRIA